VFVEYYAFVFVEYYAFVFVCGGKHAVSALTGAGRAPWSVVRAVSLDAQIERGTRNSTVGPSAFLLGGGRVVGGGRVTGSLAHTSASKQHDDVSHLRLFRKVPEK